MWSVLLRRRLRRTSFREAKVLASYLSDKRSGDFGAQMVPDLPEKTESLYLQEKTVLGMVGTCQNYYYCLLWNIKSAWLHVLLASP